MPKTLADYTGPNFADPQHPGHGQPFLILNGPQGNGQFDFDCSAQALSHRVSFAVPWEGLGDFVRFCLMGTAVASGPITRTLPLLSPYASIFPFTYATRVGGKGDGSDPLVTDARPFADCIVTVQFDTIPWTLEGAGAFLEISYSGSADFSTIPAAKLQFANGEAIDHDAGRLVGQESIQATYHVIPDPDAWLAAVKPIKGMVNEADLVIDGVTYAAGTILFPTYDLNKTVGALGARTAEATIQLLQRDIGWNQAVRSDGEVDDIFIEGTETQPYPTADLSSLLSL